MTLRDALAAALWKHEPAPSSEYADAILSDPAFRAALTEAVEAALHDMDVRDYQHRPKGTWIEALSAAHIIVARMLP